MPATFRLSSKQWKASALEKTRAAEEQAAAQRHYQAQLEELQARLKAAAELERRNSEQALIEQQAARNQEFEEISLVKQADFRKMLANEVFTRVAQQLKTDDDYRYVQAIVENRPGFEDPTEFKAMLWEAIAGNDASYLSQAAQKISEQYGMPISDNNIGGIEDSVACLDRGAIIAAQEETPTHQTEEENTNWSQSVEKEVSTTEVTHPLSRSTPIDQVDELDVHQSSAKKKEENVQSSADVKEEHSALETSASHESTTRKRSMTEEGTPIPDEAEGTTTPKKRKTTGNTNVKTPSSKFKVYMQERGNITEADLLCSVCDQEPKTPRASGKCRHLYCNSCFAKLKGETKGKDAHSVPCCHAGCDGILGAMSHIGTDTIKELRDAIVEEDADQDMIEDDASGHEDEMTEMTEEE